MFLMTNSFCINKKSFLPIAIFLLIIFFSAIYKINSKNLTYKTQASSPKIYGGQPADPGEWPFTVALYDKRIYNKNFLDRNSNTYKIGTLKDAQFCTGLLINNRYVLTAAHCLYEQIADPTEFAIYKKRVVKDFGVAVGFHDINTREIITSRDLKQALVEAKNYLIYEGYNYGFKYRDSIPFVEFNKMTDTQQNNDLAYIKIDPLDKSLSFETISLTKDQRLIKYYFFIIRFAYEKSKLDKGFALFRKNVCAGRLVRAAGRKSADFHSEFLRNRGNSCIVTSCATLSFL